MYQPLLLAHSILRYVVLILLILVIVKALSGWLGKKNFTKSDEKLPLFLMISAHTQLLVGIFLYIVNPMVQFKSGFMKAPITRYWTMEHILMMVIAIALITIGKSSLKRLTSSESKYKRLFIMNTLALIIIIVTILMMTKVMEGTVGFFQIRGL